MRRFRCNSGTRAAALAAGTIALGLASAARPVAAQGRFGPLTAPTRITELAAANQECCRLLLLPVGARQTAMAMAVAPVASPDAVFYNPAGLAQLSGNHFVLHHLESDFQPYDAFTLLVSPGNLAVFGVSYALLDYGDQDLTGENETVVGRVSAADHVLIASFATALTAGVAAGLNYKYYNWRIECSGQCGTARDVSAVTHVLDFGVQYQPSWLTQLRFGASLLNVGLPLQVINSEQSDPPPTRLRLGASYDVLQHVDSVGPYRLLLLVEAQEDDWQQPTTPNTSVGFEASVADFVFLRGGYGAGGEGLEAGPAVGLGIVYSSFNISVAKRVDGGVGGDEPFQLTLDIGF